MLFDILPELLIIDHPATNGLVVPRKPNVSRQQALKRAAKHGPHVYAALLNAMSKAGEVGLAERIFILAQQAERASQIPGFVEDVPPWRLTVHAYTALMQCYARVAHGRLPGFKRSKYHPGGALLTPEMAWKPKARHFRQGYARYVYSAGAGTEGMTRRQASRWNAMLLYRSMMSGGNALLAQMLATNADAMRDTRPRKTPRQGEPTWFVLLPDERFFNAAMKLFRPRASRNRRSAPSSPAQRRTSPGRVRTPMLQRLAKAIVAHGYGLPARYQYLLSKPSKRVSARNTRRTAVRRPYVFPPVPQDDGSRSMAGVLPTTKTRGLPLRKKMPTWIARRRRRTEHVRDEVVNTS